MGVSSPKRQLALPFGFFFDLNRPNGALQMDLPYSAMAGASGAAGPQENRVRQAKELFDHEEFADVLQPVSIALNLQTRHPNKDCNNLS